jgi:dethiobiotin synthetase
MTTTEAHGDAALRMPPRGLFVTGTDTDCGKTYVACGIVRVLRQTGLRVGVYKPVASGCSADRPKDHDGWRLWDAAGRPGRLEDVCPQTFTAPLAPHLAARAEGREVDERRLIEGISAWSAWDLVVVEGVGGLMSPVSDNLYVADLAAEFRLPLVVVVRDRLGAINQTLQTLITATTFCDGLNVAGMVLNTATPDAAATAALGTVAELRTRCVPPLLAQVGWEDPSALETVDWLSLAIPANGGEHTS